MLGLADCPLTRSPQSKQPIIMSPTPLGSSKENQDEKKNFVHNDDSRNSGCINCIYRYSLRLHINPSACFHVCNPNLSNRCIIDSNVDSFKT